MTTTDARTGIEWIDLDECLRLLANEEVGRLAITQGRTPQIFPVNYVLDGKDVVFRTDPGVKLADGPRSPACFEIDSFDRDARTGWSVIATGRLEEVTPYDARTYDRVQRLPIQPWAGGAKAHWVRLIPSYITGRRVGGPTGRIT
jgi:uncharacterized protein